MRPYSAETALRKQKPLILAMTHTCWNVFTYRSSDQAFTASVHSGGRTRGYPQATFTGERFIVGRAASHNCTFQAASQTRLASSMALHRLSHIIMHITVTPPPAEHQLYAGAGGCATQKRCSWSIGPACSELSSPRAGRFCPHSFYCFNSRRLRRQQRGVQCPTSSLSIAVSTRGDFGDSRGACNAPPHR